MVDKLPREIGKCWVEKEEKAEDGTLEDSVDQ